MGKHLWFAMTLIVQVGILAALPLGQVESGRSIWLKARSHGFRDAWQGTGVRFDYPAARLEWLEGGLIQGATRYAVLEQDSTWTIVRTGSDYPREVVGESVVLRGRIALARDPIRAYLAKNDDGEWEVDSVRVGGRRFFEDREDRTVAVASVKRHYIDFGLEDYFIPERERERVIRDIRDHPEVPLNARSFVCDGKIPGHDGKTRPNHGVFCI